MTDIDLKRLAVDLEYWPKEAEAFFYMPKGVFKPFFAKYANHSDFSVEGMSGGWIGEKLDGESYHVFSECWEMIPRPTKKAKEIEWDGSAFPIPAGAKCEVQMGSFWYPGTVIASTTEAAWFKADQNGEFWTIMNGLSIRPLLTKHERQREELCAIASKYSDLGHVIVDDILARYTLEPKP